MMSFLEALGSSDTQWVPAEKDSTNTNSHTQKQQHVCLDLIGNEGKHARFLLTAYNSELKMWQVKGRRAVWDWVWLIFCSLICAPDSIFLSFFSWTRKKSDELGVINPASILRSGHSHGSSRPLLPLRSAHQWGAHLNNVWALGLEPISCQRTVINRNALLIIIITLTCAFLLEGLIFQAEEFVGEGEGNCLQLFAPDGCTMSRRKQAKPQHIDSDEPASLGNGKFYAQDGRVGHPEK